jgi:hypothetical protein
MDINIVWDGEAMHFTQKMRAAINHFGRNDPVLQDELAVVHILEEKVKGFQPLPDAFLNIAPFGGRDDPRDDIEGKDLLDAFPAAVNGKGDTLAHKQALSQLFFFAKLLDAHLLQEIHHTFILLTDSTRGVHFIPGPGIHKVIIQ